MIRQQLALLLLSLAAAASWLRLPLPRRLEAVVLDADGTFLDPDHKVTSANAKAIKAAREAGLRVFLATGRARSGPWVQECLEPLDLIYPGVFIQGLTAFNADNRRVHNAKLGASAVEAIERVCEKAVEGGLSVTLGAYVQERLVIACGDSCDAYVARYASYGDGDIELIGDMFDDPDMCELDSTDISACLGPIDLHNANKILVLADEDSVEQLRAALEAGLRADEARVVKALDWTLEVLPPACSKWAGLKVLLDELGIDARRVMAVGDGENDLEMINSVGLGVAMGNAQPVLKKAAKVVTGTNAESGVAQAIRTYALPRAPTNVGKGQKRSALQRLLQLGKRW